METGEQRKTTMGGEWDNEGSLKKKKDGSKNQQIKVQIWRTNERVDRAMGQEARRIRMECHSRTGEENDEITTRIIHYAQRPTLSMDNE